MRPTLGLAGWGSRLLGRDLIAAGRWRCLSGGTFVDSGPTEGAEAADSPSVGMQAVGACDLLELAFDLEEVRLTEAVGTVESDAVVTRLLKFREELADLVGEFLGGAEVAGVLASILSIDEPVVGSKSAARPGSVGGDHGADVGEGTGVSADEVEGWFGHGISGGRYICTCVSVYTFTVFCQWRNWPVVAFFWGGTCTAKRAVLRGFPGFEREEAERSRLLACLDLGLCRCVRYRELAAVFGCLADGIRRLPVWLACLPLLMATSP